MQSPLLVVMVIAAALRFFFAQGNGYVGLEAEADGMCRLFESQILTESPDVVPGGLSWLPLPYWMYLAVGATGVGVVAAGKIVSFVFGILTVLFFYLSLIHI